MITSLLCWLLGCGATLVEGFDIAWEVEHGHPNRFLCERCRRPIRWKALGGWERVPKGEK